MYAPNAIVLRIFSGPHIGAELQLPVGDHVVGSEDSCDIILVDSSLLGRHAIVHVVAQAPNLAAALTTDMGDDGQADEQGKAEAAFAVSVTPLDGQIIVADELVSPEGTALSACTLFEVGTTSLAWNAVGLPWSDMSAALALRRGDIGVVDPVADPDADVIEDADADTLGGDAGLSFYDDLEVGLDGEQGSEAGAAKPENLSLRQKAQKVASLPIKTLIAIFLAILCVCGVMVSFEGRAPDMVMHAEELEGQLHRMGMAGLSVTKKDGGIIVGGVLDSDAQRAELWRVTAGLLYPVEITATVREDLLSAVTAAFNSRHMYPEVLPMSPVPEVDVATEADANVDTEPEATKPDNIALQISGYFQDGQVEAWAFQAMHEDVPATFTAQRNVRHEEDVKPVLVSLLREANLKHVRTRFRPGVVQVAGHFDIEQHAALDDVLIAVQDQLGVPIRFEVYAELPKSIQAAAATNTSDSRALADAHKEAKKEAKLAGEADGDLQPLGDLKVISVTLSPLCFFTTDDGQRFFEGAVLPSGYSVEKITMDALTLKKDGTEKVHDLRGDHD